MTVNLIALALMPISHATSWHLLLQTTDDSATFHQTVAMISAFYCAWALVKKYVQGDKKEMGHLSMGILCAASLLFAKKFTHLVMVADIMVIFNFAFVVPFFVNRGVTGIVKMVHKEVTTLTLVWGYTFLAYLLGNIVMWCFVLKTLVGFRWASVGTTSSSESMHNITF